MTNECLACVYVCVCASGLPIRAPVLDSCDLERGTVLGSYVCNVFPPIASLGSDVTLWVEVSGSLGGRQALASGAR